MDWKLLKSEIVFDNFMQIEERTYEFIDVELIDLPDFLKIVRSGQMTDVEAAMLGLDRLGLLTAK